MADSNLSKALYVFSHFESKSGCVLDSNYFLGVGRLRSWSASELQDGIEQARKRGFVEEAVDGWRLTEAGFREIECVVAQ